MIPVLIALAALTSGCALVPIGSRPAAPAAVTSADLIGLWKYESKGRGYEREFRADGSLQAYVACGNELPDLNGCRWKIDGDRILVTAPGAPDRVGRMAGKDRLDFVTENISAVRDSATTPYPVPSSWWLSRHTKCCAVAAKGGIDVLFLGDSITHGWENAGKAVWDREIAPLRAANFGFSGDHTENVLWRLMNGELPATLQPKVAVLMIGTNNSGYRWGKHGEKPELIAAGILAIVDQLRAHNPKTQILLLGIFPRGPSPADLMRQNNEAVNRILAKRDGQKNLKYLDLGALFLAADGSIPRTIMPDLLHPNENGYRIWAAAIVPEIKKLLATTP